MAAEKLPNWDESLNTILQNMVTKDDIVRIEKSFNDDLKEQAKSFKEDLSSLSKSFKDDLIRVEDKLENKISSVESGLKSEVSRVESSIKAEISRLETVLKDTIKLEVKAATSSLTTKVNFIISIIMLFAVPTVGYIVATFLKQYFPWG